jgi:hypothetical protein
VLSEFATDWASDFNPEFMIGPMLFDVMFERPKRIVRQVRRAIPAVAAEVHTPSERPLSVDQDELFVVGCSKRVMVIKDQVNSRVKFLPDAGL